MTVEQLITELKTYPPKDRVLIDMAYDLPKHPIQVISHVPIDDDGWPDDHADMAVTLWGF